MFYGCDKQACILYVPIGAKEAYLTTTPWSEFENIVEIEDITGIDEIVTDESAMQYIIYHDLNGRVVEKPSKGIYIINGKKVYIK